MRPRKGYCFVRQASGQLVYKYFDENTGFERAKRVPKDIIFKADAVEWIRVHLYGGGPKAAEPNRDEATLAKLRTLVERATTEGERQAAQQAIEKLTAKLAG